MRRLVSMIVTLFVAMLSAPAMADHDIRTTGDAGAPAPAVKDGGAPQRPAPQNAKDGGK